LGTLEVELTSKTWRCIETIVFYLMMQEHCSSHSLTPFDQKRFRAQCASKCELITFSFLLSSSFSSEKFAFPEVFVMYTPSVVRKFLTVLLMTCASMAVASTTLTEPRPFDIDDYFGPVLPKLPSQTVQLEATTKVSNITVFTVVRSGDSLGRLATKFGVSLRAIKLASGMTRDWIRPGETLKIPLSKTELEAARPARLPPGAFWHTIGRGETLSHLTSRFGVEQADLIAANPGLRSLDQLRLNDQVIIPGDTEGAYVRLKAGETAMSVVANHGADISEFIVANALVNVNDLKSGDYIVLPGIEADWTMKRLEDRRNAEAAIRAQIRFEYSKKRIASARAALAQEAASRAKLRAAQRTGVSRVRRASSQFVVPPSYSGGFIWPMGGQITSGYGRRGFWIGSSNFHTGLDIAAPYGTPIYAAKGGLVTESGYGHFGLNVRIAVGGEVVTIYGHMSRTNVYAGQYVERGQLIGWEGCSGICTGPHLHFEVQVGGTPVNPLRYLP
jgi:murein DD-endopeptidase MepM/ murein hydrolase activator NlpD